MEKNVLDVLERPFTNVKQRQGSFGLQEQFVFSAS